MRCSYIKDNGEECNANAMTDSEYCYLHNPEISEEQKREAQTRGGQNRMLTIVNPLPPMQVSKPDDVVSLLVDTINRVRGGSLDIKTANCLGVLSGHLIKALEVASLNNRLEFIEQTLTRKQTRY